MGGEFFDLSGKLLVLVRHGEARTADVDPQRSLTPQGRRTVERMAAWARSLGLHADAIVHSGILRAEQTAQVFAQRLGLEEHLSASPGLSPNDDVRLLAELLEGDERKLILVGHLPFLGRLASHLVLGDADRALVEFPPAAVVILRRRGRDWALAAALQPGLLCG